MSVDSDEYKLNNTDVCQKKDIVGVACKSYASQGVQNIDQWKMLSADAMAQALKKKKPQEDKREPLVEPKDKSETSPEPSDNRELSPEAIDKRQLLPEPKDKREPSDEPKFTREPLAKPKKKWNSYCTVL
ncbi:unnamed protein product [Gordionus sp. m RMFG-2023]